MIFISTLFIACSGSDLNKTGTQNILPLGDSITEGVPFTYRYPLHSLLTEEGIDFDFIGSHTNGAGGYPESGWDRDNEGWAGWTTESIASELPDWSSQYNVDVALIHLGTNDAGNNDIESSAAALTSIVEQLRENSETVSICIAQILPFGSQLPDEPGAPTAADLNRFVSNWNMQISSIAAELSTAASVIEIVDMNTGFGDSDLDDGVHPTAEGAEKMAEQWLDCVLSF